MWNRETEASSSNEEEDGNARQPAKRRLLDLTARLDASQRDANAGGATTPGRIQDVLTFWDLTSGPTCSATPNMPVYGMNL